MTKGKSQGDSTSLGASDMEPPEYFTILKISQRLIRRADAEVYFRIAGAEVREYPLHCYLALPLTLALHSLLRRRGSMHMRHAGAMQAKAGRRWCYR